MSSRLISGLTTCPRHPQAEEEGILKSEPSMTVNEYLNQFVQLSRYTIYDINTDEKKLDMFLKGLNDEIQFQLLNIDYPNF
jgi:hypothetical protein